MFSIKLKVCIVTPDLILKERLEREIHDRGKYLLVASYRDVTDLTHDPLLELPDFILLDDCDHLSHTISKVRNRAPESDVIVMLNGDEKTQALATLAAGAKSYMVKSADPHAMINDMEEQLEKNSKLTKMARKLVGAINGIDESPLTSRETEILELLNQGMSYTNIANQLSIGKETTKTHIKNIYAKFLVNSKAEALKVAHDNHWL